MRITDFKKGDIFFCFNPGRITKIVGKSHVSIQTRDGIEEKPCLLVDATVPTVPIEGLVDEQQANVNKTHLAPNLQATNSLWWKETWAEKDMHPQVRSSKSKATILNEKAWERQLFCVAESGRRPRLERSSSGRNKLIDGKFVKDPAVKEIFKDDSGTKEKDVEGTKQVSSQKRPNRAEPVTAGA